MQIASKLPQVGTTIFTLMSKLAKEHGAINLSQGFPDFGGDVHLSDLVCTYLQKGFNQYAPMPGVLALRQQIAEKIARLYQKTINHDTEITITAGATQAIYTALTAVLHPEDEVVLIEPAYDSYAPAIRLCGAKPVPYALRAPDYRVDWDTLETLLTPRTKMIVVNTPHNPTGMVFNRADMLRLEKLAVRYNLLVLSDEVYEHLTYDSVLHESAIQYPQLYERSFVTFSFGKTFHNTGWKIGYCVAPEVLMREFRKVHQFNVFSVNTPIQYALADYLQTPEHYTQLPAFYQQKRDFFTTALAPSRLRALPCQGTYFRLYDYTAISNEPDVAFAKRLTTEYGVAAIPISVFYANRYDARVIRLCFAKKEATLAQAAERLAAI